MSIITGPSVQLGLDLPYPTLGSIEFERQLVGIHRRPPGLPASSLPACWPPSPCGRLSRPPWRVVTPATTTRPPPRPTPSAGNEPARFRAGRTREGRYRTVPAFTTQPIDGVGAQLCPSGIATTTPWAFTVASRRGASASARSSRPAQRRSVRAATQPISARLELVGRLRGFTRWFLTYAFPSCWPSPRRLAVPARLVVVRTACRPSRRSPGQAVPSFTPLPRQPGGEGLAPSLGHTAPRGARSRRPTDTHSRPRTDPARRTRGPHPATAQSAG